MNKFKVFHALNSILFYSPDVVGFQEYCTQYTANLTPMLKNAGYTVLGNDLDFFDSVTDNADTAYDETQNMTPIASHRCSGVLQKRSRQMDFRFG